MSQILCKKNAEQRGMRWSNSVTMQNTHSMVLSTRWGHMIVNYAPLRTSKSAVTSCQTQLLFVGA